MAVLQCSFCVFGFCLREKEISCCPIMCLDCIISNIKESFSNVTDVVGSRLCNRQRCIC